MEVLEFMHRAPCESQEATKRGCVRKRKTLPYLNADGEKSAVGTQIRIGISQKEED